MSTVALHLLCGKIAAGKSTLAARLAAGPKTILLNEDAWLSRLYPGEIRTLEDYRRCAGRLRDAMTLHIGNLLSCGLSVVLDFPANTQTSRAWMRGIAEGAGTSHLLHFLDIPDDTCRARMHRRNADGSHEYAVSDSEFDLFARYFEAPTEEECLKIRRYVAG